LSDGFSGHTGDFVKIRVQGAGDTTLAQFAALLRKRIPS
jgi:hypothetical protein